MSKAPELRENPELPEQIRLAALAGHLVLFVGAGVSRLIGYPSWAELASHTLQGMQKDSWLNYSEMEQLNDISDPRKRLSIAEIIAADNNSSLDLRPYLTTTNSDKGIYTYLNNIGCVCVTTNYDEELSPCFNQTKNGSTTKASIRRISKKEDFVADHLNTPGTVIHLHGCISEESRMIVTTSQYLAHYDDEKVQYFLRELFRKKTVLFIGYGLEESEILEHILRRARLSDNSALNLFSLQGFFKSQEPLYMKLHQYYLKSFGVHLIGFIRDYKDHGQLEDIVKAWSEKIEVRPPALAEDLDFMEEVLGGT